MPGEILLTWIFSRGMPKAELVVTILNMLIMILAIVIALVAWSLHLMQQAVDRQEFSLMLAGTLVAFSAAAMVAVYFLMGNYIGYVTKMAHNPSVEPSADAITWVLQTEDFEQPMASSSWQTPILSSP